MAAKQVRKHTKKIFSFRISGINRQIMKTKMTPPAAYKSMSAGKYDEKNNAIR